MHSTRKNKRWKCNWKKGKKEDDKKQQQPKKHSEKRRKITGCLFRLGSKKETNAVEKERRKGEGEDMNGVGSLKL